MLKGKHSRNRKKPEWIIPNVSSLKLGIHNYNNITNISKYDNNMNHYIVCPFSFVVSETNWELCVRILCDETYVQYCFS